MTGIALAGSFPLAPGQLGTSWISVAIILAALAGLHFLWRSNTGILTMLPAGLLIGLTGFLSCQLSMDIVNNASIIDICDGEFHRQHAVVVTLPKYQREHLRFLVELNNTPREAPAGRCMVYLSCDPDYQLNPGDVIQLYGKFEEVELPRNRGQFNYRAYLMQKGTVVTCYLPSIASVDVLDDSGSRRLGWLSRLRTRLTGNMSEGMPPELADLAISVVFGDKITDLPEELEERFRRAGLTHILVASGTQVSLLIVLLALAFWRMPRSFDLQGSLLSLLQFTVTMGVVLIYAGITGYETSIVRALCMGLLLCSGRFFLRNVDGLSTLAQAGLILLIIQPLQLFTPGFQLSFLATLGLIYIMGTFHPLVKAYSGWRRFLLDALLTTGGAQLFVMPVLASSFNQFSLVGLASNILAVPLALVLLLVGSLASLGLTAIPVIGPVLLWILIFLSRLLDGLSNVFASLSWSSISIPSPAPALIFLFYVTVFITCEWFRNRDRLDLFRIRLLQPTLAVLILVMTGWVSQWLLIPEQQLALIRLERSNAIYLREADGRNYLFARSYWLSRRHNDDNLISSLKSRGVNQLDAVIWLDAVPDKNPLEDLSPYQFNLSTIDSISLPIDWLSISSPEHKIGMIYWMENKPVVCFWPDNVAALDQLIGTDEHFSQYLICPSYEKEPVMPQILNKHWSDQIELTENVNWISVNELEQSYRPGQSLFRLSPAEICIEPAPGDRLRSFTFSR